MPALRVAILVALILALTPMPAAAADVRYGQDIRIASGETVDDDLYAFGQNIAIDGTVNGDVVAAGQTITIDGSVTGDVIAAGNIVTIRGSVGGTVRASGTSITLDNTVGKDVVVAGANFDILGNGRVGRDVLAGATKTNIAGQVARDVQAAGASVRIDGTVGRDVTAQGDQIEVTGRGTIGGALRYTSAHEAKIANAGSVKGQVEHRTPDSTRAPLVTGPAAMVVDWLKGLIGLLIMGILIVFFFPEFSRRAGEALVRSPWASLAFGALVLIGLPILAIVFFVIGVLIGGWWIGLVVLAVYGVTLALSFPVAAVGVGAALLRITRRPAPVWLALLLGLVILLLVAIIPILGPLVVFVACLFGLGATAMAVAGGRRATPAPS